MKGDPWTAVASLARSIDDGEHGLEFVPQLLKIVIVEDCWRDFVTPLKKVVHYERFEDFVTTPPTKG